MVGGRLHLLPVRPDRLDRVVDVHRRPRADRAPLRDPLPHPARVPVRPPRDARRPGAVGRGVPDRHGRVVGLHGPLQDTTRMGLPGQPAARRATSPACSPRSSTHPARHRGRPHRALGIVLARRWAPVDALPAARARARLRSAADSCSCSTPCGRCSASSHVPEDLQETLERARVIALAIVPFAFLAGLLRSRVAGGHGGDRARRAPRPASGAAAACATRSPTRSTTRRSSSPTGCPSAASGSTRRAPRSASRPGAGPRLHAGRARRASPWRCSSTTRRWPRSASSSVP